MKDRRLDDAKTEVYEVSDSSSLSKRDIFARDIQIGLLSSIAFCIYSTSECHVFKYCECHFQYSAMQYKHNNVLYADDL